jgi:PhzF family phenazine biosynthesis protein
MTIELFHVDAFADRPFSGNPAAVCLLKEPAELTWMQHLAMEMNLSETAFVVPAESGCSLRWFTPGEEVDLCGHATLASAHVLWETGRLSETEPAQFHTRSGVLSCSLQNQSGGWISMDFPARPAEECESPPGLLEALGCEANFIGTNRMDVLVEVESDKTVRRLSPDFRALRRVKARGVIVTARSAVSDSGIDFVSRFFAPAAGVDEDPVTGSAHCCLAPYWAGKLGRNELVGYQASERGGTVRMQLQNDRVILTGQAVTVMQGALTKSAAPQRANTAAIAAHPH